MSYSNSSLNDIISVLKNKSSIQKRKFKKIKERICCLIPARMHSTRLPNKPLLKINGKTMIVTTCDRVIKCSLIDDIFVVTDNEEIENECKLNNYKVIRVNDLCYNGTERIAKAINKLDNKYDIIVNVQGDEPFIDPNNIDFLIKNHLRDNNYCSTLHSVNRIKKGEDTNSIVKLVTNCNNDIMYMSRSNIPGYKKDNILEYKCHIGIYIFSSNH